MAPELKGYQTQGVTPSIGGVAQPMAAQAAGQTSQSLASKLSEFNNMALQAAKAQAQDQAVEDATRDSIEGKPFYKESVYTAYGQAYNNAASATYAANANIETQRMSDELMLQHENNPLAYTTAMTSFVDELGKQAPTDSLRATIKISGTKLKNSVFGHLSQQENQRIKAAQKETFYQESQLNIGQIVNLESAGDTAAADILKKKNLIHMNALEAEGVLTPAESIKYTKQSNFQIRKGTAENNMMELLKAPSLENAATLLDNYRTTKSQDLDIDEHEAIYRELSSLFTSEIKARKAAEKDTQDFSNQIVGDAIDIFKNGKIPDNLTQVRGALANASDAKKWEFNTQVKAARIYHNDLKMLSLSEMEDKLNAMEADTTISKIELEVMQTLRKNLHDKQTAVRDDVVGQAVRDGIIPTGVRMSPQNGVDNFLKGLSGAKSNTNKIKVNYGIDKDDVLSKQDAQEWADYLGSSTVKADDKLAFIAKVNNQYPELSKQVFNQIGGKNAGTFALAADLAINGNSPAAKTMLLGKGADVELDVGIKTALKTKLGNSFGGYDSKTFNTYFNGLIDYAKGKSLEGEILSADDIVEGSIGKIEKYNNKSTIIPFGVEKRAFESWLDNIVIPKRPDVQKGLRDMTDRFGNGQYQLHYAGQGQYYVVDDNDGNPITIRSEEDKTKPMILKWGK